MEKLMLVNVVEPEESRIAIVEDGQLEELYVERKLREQIVGNIYKAKVANIERSLQAAFVEFGGKRHGFLHMSDISPSWYNGDHRKKGRDKDRRRESVQIQEVLQKGQELMVQVSKEGIRNKAPAVTTYASLPGRYLVLMPQVSNRHGVSRKIQDENERTRLREALDDMNIPAGVGVIARTAAEGRTKRELQRDLNYLQRLYQAVEKKYREAGGPALLYEESDLVIRAVRDVFSTDIDEMLVDSESHYRKILQFMRATMPAYRKRVKLCREDEPLFHKYHIENQIDQIYQKRVHLRSGGSIVLEQTEALVAIDVNSGKFKREKNAEDSAYKINLEAAREIARQIRLRDLGGVIINDFIDLENDEYCRDVERTLWTALKRDRARTRMLRMSRFGIIEMTRQRVRQNIEGASYETCPTCSGTGLILTLESAVLNVYRRLRAALKKKNVDRIEVLVEPSVAEYLLNRKRRDLVELENQDDIPVEITGDAGYSIDRFEINCYTATGKVLKG